MFSRLFKAFTGAQAPATAKDVAEPTWAALAPLCDGNRFGDALEIVGAALALRADAPEVWLLRAKVLDRQGRRFEAVAAYERAEALGSAGPQFDLAFGEAIFALGDAARAEPHLRIATRKDPDSADAHHALAEACLALNRSLEARESVQQALALREDGKELELLGRILLRDEREAGAAERALRDAIAKSPARSEPWKYLGVVLSRQGRYGDAIAAFEHAVALDLEMATDAFVLLGMALGEERRWGEALEVFERALPHRPVVDGYFTYAVTLLTVGRIGEGFEASEFRRLREPALSSRAKGPHPHWTGQPMRGRSVVIIIEQGVGDNIQFLRYATMLEAEGARVLVRRFDEAISGIAGVHHAFGENDTGDADYIVNGMSLPRIFGTTLDTIPASVPYLAVPEERRARWGARLPPSNDLKIGIVWAGNAAHARDRFRSIPPAFFSSLLEVTGIRWYSLQKGTGERDMATLALGATVEILGPELGDFADTAAVIGLLDLVICVDTSVAHVAGALGKPVWILLPTPCDWRWLEDREDSPWYPSARLFRQRGRGDWSGVFARVRSALLNVVEGRAALEPVRTPGGPLPAPLNVRPRARPGYRAGMASVAEARWGIFQYVPTRDDTLGWYGEWRQCQVALLSHLVGDGATVLELGADVGAHAVPLGAWVGVRGHLLVEERDAVAKQLLTQNLSANGVRNVTVLRDTLEDAGGVDGLWLTQLTLLKVNDAARSEAVLAGAGNTLWRLRPLVLLCAENEIALSALAAQVREFGYRSFRHAAPAVSADNFNGRAVDAADAEALLTLLALPEERQLEISLSDCVELA